jgi:hypothetical protein
MNQDSVEETQRDDAMDKAQDILSEHLEAGIIIGTYIDENGITRKSSQSWGNDFAVSALVAVAAREVEIISEICSHAEEDE